MCESGVEGFETMTLDRRQADRHFVEDEDFVEADLHRLVQFFDDVDAAQTLRQVERLILLPARDVALSNAFEAGDLRGFCLLPVRVRLEGDGLEEGSVEGVGRELYQLRPGGVALPELERPALDRGLIGERAEDEAAVRLRVILLELRAAFEREIRAVDEILVEAVALRVDVVDAVPFLAVDDEHDVRQGVRRVGVDARQRVELRLRLYRRERARRFRHGPFGCDFLRRTFARSRPLAVRFRGEEGRG